MYFPPAHETHFQTIAWECASVLSKTQRLSPSNGIHGKERVLGEILDLVKPCVNRTSKHAACLHRNLSTWGEFLEQPPEPSKSHSKRECSLLCDLSSLQPLFRRGCCFLLDTYGSRRSSQRPGIVTDCGVCSWPWHFFVPRKMDHPFLYLLHGTESFLRS